MSAFPASVLSSASSALSAHLQHPPPGARCPLPVSTWPQLGVHRTRWPAARTHLRLSVPACGCHHASGSPTFLRSVVAALPSHWDTGQTQSHLLATLSRVAFLKGGPQTRPRLSQMC